MNETNPSYEGIPPGLKKFLWIAGPLSLLVILNTFAPQKVREIKEMLLQALNPVKHEEKMRTIHYEDGQRVEEEYRYYDRDGDVDDGEEIQDGDDGGTIFSRSSETKIIHYDDTSEEEVERLRRGE